MRVTGENQRATRRTKDDNNSDRDRESKTVSTSEEAHRKMCSDGHREQHPVCRPLAVSKGSQRRVHPVHSRDRGDGVQGGQARDTVCRRDDRSACGEGPWEQAPWCPPVSTRCQSGEASSGEGTARRGAEDPLDRRSSARSSQRMSSQGSTSSVTGWEDPMDDGCCLVVGDTSEQRYPPHRGDVWREGDVETSWAMGAVR